MTEFTIVIKPTVIECVAGKEPKARAFYAGGGLRFYIVGMAGKRVGAALNVMMNKAIELGVQPRALKRECGCGMKSKKPAKNQPKLF